MTHLIVYCVNIRHKYLRLPDKVKQWVPLIFYYSIGCNWNWHKCVGVCQMGLVFFAGRRSRVKRTYLKEWNHVLVEVKCSTSLGGFVRAICVRIQHESTQLVRSFVRLNDHLCISIRPQVCFCFSFSFCFCVGCSKQTRNGLIFRRTRLHRSIYLDNLSLLIGTNQHHCFVFGGCAGYTNYVIL